MITNLTTSSAELRADLDDVDIEDDPKAQARACASAGNALAAAEAAFNLLTTGPSPLALDGATIGHGLPRRAVDLAELRGFLLDGHAGQELKDGVWVELVQHSRADGPAWVIGCVGVALPGLKGVAGRVRRSSPVSIADDIVSELLTEFVAQLARIDITRPHISARLMLWARKGALRVRAREVRHIPRDPTTIPAIAHVPETDPAELLADAVRQGIITPQAADLIRVTRLDRMSLASYARDHGVPEDRLRKQRKVAETRLAQAICRGQVAALSFD